MTEEQENYIHQITEALRQAKKAERSSVTVSTLALEFVMHDCFRQLVRVKEILEKHLSEGESWKLE